MTFTVRIKSLRIKLNKNMLQTKTNWLVWDRTGQPNNVSGCEGKRSKI
jgi:hypothetical protein